MFWKQKELPVLLAGMWPALSSDPESGARVLIQDRDTKNEIARGLSDTNGEFKGRIPGNYAGKKVRIVVVEPSFIFDDYDAVTVNKWGLFLAIRQKKDTVYNGHKGAKNIDPVKWGKWNAAQEHAHASQRTHSAARAAKVRWPIETVGYFAAIALGIVGFFIHPALGLAAGLGVALGLTYLARYLLVAGY
jgi:hypothetical protein